MVRLALLLTLSSGVSAIPAPKIRLYILDCGRLTAFDRSVFSPGKGRGKRLKLRNNCYLVVHPAGSLMWDTGLSDKTGKKPRKAGMFRLAMPKTVRSQLEAIGIAPQEVTYLALSHFHFDHVGNANLFKKSRLLVQKEDYKAAFGKKPGRYSFNPKYYRKLRRSKVSKLKGDHDVFGDGTVIIKRAVGHTPGHQMLFINLPKTGPILLSGDLWHFAANRKYNRVPTFNYNKKKTLRTMKKMERFAREKGAQIWIQHDPKQAKKMRYAPAFYD